MICQSNLEIAGSPRNNFRVSLVPFSDGGRALNGLGGVSLPNPIKLRMPSLERAGVGLRVMRFVAERETTQPAV